MGKKWGGGLLRQRRGGTFWEHDSVNLQFAAEKLNMTKKVWFDVKKIWGRKCELSKRKKIPSN